jgi:hypothetical protein
VTTAPALEDERHELPGPLPHGPVVLAHRISPGNRHPNPRYSDLTWSLAALIDNPGATRVEIRWVRCPEQLREQVKALAWVVINGELKATYLQTRGPKARARWSASSIQAIVGEWISLARWLCPRGVTDLAGCTDDHWRSYIADRRADGGTRELVATVLGWLTHLWAFDQLAGGRIGVGQPPWEVEGVDDYLPATTGAGHGENATQPIDPQVIGPLLVWAIRMVDDLADDVLAGWDENRRLSDLAAKPSNGSAGRAALEAYLLPLIASGAPIPTIKRHGADAVARAFICAVTGASSSQVDRFNRAHGLTALAAQRPGGCLMQVPITGRIDGRPWREHLDFNEAGELMRHLATAAMIICLYLTGMRPQEKRAELHLMKHSTPLNNGLVAAQSTAWGQLAA